MLTQSFNIVNTPIILLFSKNWVAGLAEEDNRMDLWIGRRIRYPWGGELNKVILYKDQHIEQDNILTLKVLVATIDALRHFETG